MTNEMSERIRAALAKSPRKMTLQLARDLGVPEVEVIRAFPVDRATEPDIARWEELLRSLEALGSVRVLVSNGATTIGETLCPLSVAPFGRPTTAFPSG